MVATEPDHDPVVITNSCILLVSNEALGTCLLYVLDSIVAYIPEPLIYALNNTNLSCRFVTVSFACKLLVNNPLGVTYIVLSPAEEIVIPPAGQETYLFFISPYPADIETTYPPIGLFVKSPPEIVYVGFKYGDNQEAVILRNSLPSPLNDPVNAPVNGAVKLVNCVDCDINVGLFATLAYSTLEAVTANDDVVANEADAGTNVIDVAALAVLANDAVDGTNVIEFAAEAVVANEAVVGVNVIEVAADAVVANELLIADCAQLLVPNNDPVIPPDITLNDPVISALPMTCNSTGKLLDNISDPVIRWFPTNILEPVVANVAIPVVFRTSI